MRLLSRLWVLALVALAIVGCNEVTTPPDTAQLQLTVRDGQMLLVGARICQTEVTNCVTTDVNGNATLELPAHQKLSYTIEKEGYGSRLWPVVTGAGSGRPSPRMDSDERLTDALADLESPYPLRDTGVIHVIIDPGFAGATFELVTATGKAFYDDEEGNWSLDLDATTSRGRGGFVEVGPGDFQIQIGGTAQDCALGPIGGGTRFGWPGDADNGFEAPVREGFFTYVVIRCPLPL